MNKVLLEELSAEELAKLTELNCFDGIAVKCRGCGGRYHELTAKYVPATAVRGSYLRLLKAYGPGGRGWYDFPHQDWVVGDNVACPQCGTPYRARWLLRCVLTAVMPAPEGVEPEEMLEPLGDVNGSVASEAVSEQDQPGLGGRVLALTYEGRTQVEIAETCGISVYMVRRFQKGERLP